MNIELVSVHVPKTAGTSFFHVLKEIYGEAAIFRDNGEYVGRKLPEIPLEPHHRVIHGQLWARRYIRMLPQVRHVVWVRHPVDWLTSLYQFLKSVHLPENPAWRYLKTDCSSLLDFAASEGVRMQTQNRFLRRVSLDEFFFVGIQEYFAEDLSDFCREMGWPDVPPPSENRNLTTELLQLRSEVWSNHDLVNALCDRLQDDVNLYEAAVKLRASRRQQATSKKPVSDDNAGTGECPPVTIEAPNPETPLSVQTEPEPDNGLLALAQRYADFSPPAFAYGTVRDFCDSVDNFGTLATSSADLKDLQRPWTIKAILGGVPKGGRLIEIGAGQPLVADYLTKLGYDVTVVDPYDGSGNGPREYEYFREAYPHIHFVREKFDLQTTGLQPAAYDAVYSISVLEHIPIEELPLVCAGIRKFLAPGRGKTIHAVDHIIKGANHPYHTKHLKLLTGQLGLSPDTVAATLEAARDDAETYLLSAEAHNRWRNVTPYDQFPMRRVISVQICLPPTSR